MSLYRLVLSVGSLCIYACTMADSAEAQWDGLRPDGHAPIGVMGDHVHDKGEWMASYRFSYMEMDGNRDGTSSQSTSEILSKYPVASTDMSMEMHMLGLMYAPNNDVTLMAMLPYTRKFMNHTTRMGRKFKTKGEGQGDLKVTGLIKIYDSNRHKLHLNAGMSFPTGSVNRRDNTPMGEVRLPYPMQTGSGTHDLLPGITYLGQTDQFSWGAQALANIRLGRNRNGYRLGDQYEASTWGSIKLSNSVSSSIRVRGLVWEDIDGEDSDLSPMMSPTADPDLRSGQRIDLIAGVNFYCRNGMFKGHRLAIEAGAPVYQDLDGPQLETDWFLTSGWQLAWGG